MIRFGARGAGAYLLLVAQGKALTGEGALVGEQVRSPFLTKTCEREKAQKCTISIFRTKVTVVRMSEI